MGVGLSTTNSHGIPPRFLAAAAMKNDTQLQGLTEFRV
jgi:hypothetical protein